MTANVPTCVRSGNCQLQEVANDLGILELPFETQLQKGCAVRGQKHFRSIGM